MPTKEDCRWCVLVVHGFENHLVFYIERSGHIGVLHVLPIARDIPAALLDH